MKIIKWFLLITALAFLSWYLFFRDYDSRAVFTFNTTVGTVNQSIKSWNSSLRNSQPTVQINENELIQKIIHDNLTYNYHWKINSINDSTVTVAAYVLDKENSLKNRLFIPFTETYFEENAKSDLKSFKDALSNHLKEIRIKIEGEADSPSSDAAYVEVKSLQITKAKGMMANFNLLSSFIEENKLEPNGQPFLEITSWDRKTDSITYYFAFPFKKTAAVEGNTLVSIKQFPSKKSIKAIYNGNYITSDRAWYALESYAKKNNIEFDMHPIEVFHNNPNMGGNEIEWKTEIYLPIKED